MKMKESCGDHLMERNSFPFTRSSSIYLVISISLFFLPACQSQPRQLNENTPAARTESAANLPHVTQIDAVSLKDLLKPNGKPLLINFWATWCGPCREEFPDLVKLGRDHDGKLDLITISLDEASEINSEVPKFLAQMKSGSPAYLLKESDESAAIELVSKDWQGALPFTILFNAEGEAVYSVQGKFKPDVLTAEIEKLY